MSDKCPGCGAAKDEQRTIDLRALRPRGEDTSGCVVWRCGRNTIRREPTLRCVERQLAQAKGQLAARDARIKELRETLKDMIERFDIVTARQGEIYNAAAILLAQEAAP